MPLRSAQAVFTSGQRQGSAAAPNIQTGAGNGGDAQNLLRQTATIIQTGNTVDLTGSFDLEVIDEGPLTPRSAALIASLNKNSAITSSAASQEQVLMQSGAGGVNEDGSVTENGKGTGVPTESNSSVSNDEGTTVTNSISVII